MFTWFGTRTRVLAKGRFAKVWRTSGSDIELYQAIQAKNRFAIGETLASFVVTPPPLRKTLFVLFIA